MKKFLVIALSLLAIFGVLRAVDAYATAYPPAVGGTGTTVVPSSGQVLIGNGAGTYTPAYVLCAGTCQVSTSSGSVTITGTGVATNTGNWAGTWQLFNPSDFLSSSTQKVVSVNGSSGVVTITSSTLGVVWPTVNGNKATNYNIVAGTGVTSTVSGATTTLSINLNNGSTQTCSANQFVTQVTSSGIVTCGSVTFPTIPTYTFSSGTGLSISQATSTTNTTTTITNTGVTSFSGQGCVTAGNSTGSVALTVTCISGNQSITFTITGDATGTASGATSITDNITVTGLNGKTLPALATGTLQYSGGAWKINLATSSLGVYDANGNLSSYLGSSCGGSQFVSGISANGTVSCGTPTGGASSTNVYGANGVVVVQVGVNATATLDTTYAAIWTALETFSKGLTANGTTTLASTTNAIAVTDASGHVLAFAGSNPCSAGQAAQSISATGTLSCVSVVTSTAGNWTGTWQGTNSSTFYLASNPNNYISSSTGNTLYYPLSSNPSGYLTSAPATTTVNGNQGPNFQIVAGTGVTSTVSGATTTIALNLGTGCSGSNFVQTISPTGTLTCAVPTGGASSTNVYGTNGVIVNQAGVNATATLDTSYPASWTGLETFLNGLNASGTLNVSGTIRIPQTTGRFVMTGTGGFQAGIATSTDFDIFSNGGLELPTGGNVTSDITLYLDTSHNAFFAGNVNTSGTLSVSGVGVCTIATCLSTSTGNWLGTWQLYSPSDFATSSSIPLTYVGSLSNNSASGGIDFSKATGTSITGVLHSLNISQFTNNVGYITAAPATTTVNGTQSPTFNINGSGNVTTTVSGATTTFSITGVIPAANGGTATTTPLGSCAFLSTCGSGGGGSNNATGTIDETAIFNATNTIISSQPNYVPSNFATAGCAGSSTATTINGCIQAIVAQDQALGYIAATIYVTHDVVSSTYPAPINLNTNGFPVQLECTAGTRLFYNGVTTSTQSGAIVFNFGNPIGHATIMEGAGCNFLGHASLIAAGNTNTATTTGAYIGGSNGAVGIVLAANFNGFGRNYVVGQNAYMFNFIGTSSGGNGGVMTTTGTTINASTTITGVTNPQNLIIGGYISGTGIPNNTQITGAGTSTITISNAATSGNSTTTLTVNFGSLAEWDFANNSGERALAVGGTYTDPGNSSATNALYVANGAVADVHILQNAIDDAHIYCGSSDGLCDIEQNHEENSDYSQYGSYHLVTNPSSDLSTLIVYKGNEIANDTSGANSLGTLIVHGGQLQMSGNILNNYGNGTVPALADHSNDNGLEGESICGNTVSGGTLTNIVAGGGGNSYSQAAALGCSIDVGNSFTINIFPNSNNTNSITSGNNTVATFNHTGDWTLGIAGASGSLHVQGALNATGTITQSGVPVLTGVTSTTDVIYVDGNRSDSYTQTGNILYPFKTISAAIAQAYAVSSSYQGFAFSLAPATYVDGAPDTWPTQPFTIQGNEATYVIPSGATFPGSFDIYDLTVVGNVTESDNSLTFIHQFNNGVINGNLTLAGLATLSNMTMPATTSTLTTLPGSLVNITGSAIYANTIDDGIQTNFDDVFLSASSSQPAILSTTTGAIVNVNGASIFNFGTGGGISISNGATSTPNNLANFSLVENSSTACSAVNTGSAAANMSDTTGLNNLSGTFIAPCGSAFGTTYDENRTNLATSTFKGNVYLPALATSSFAYINSAGILTTTSTPSGGGGGGATTTVNGVSGPTFTFSIVNTSTASSITTSTANLFLNLLQYTSGTDINVAANGVINFVNTPGYLTSANGVTTYNGSSGAINHNFVGTGNVTTTNAVSGGNTTTTISITGVIGSANGGTATTTALGACAFLSTCGSGGSGGVSTSTPVTSGTIPLFSGTSAITNSLITQSSSQVAVTNGSSSVTFDVSTSSPQYYLNIEDKNGNSFLSVASTSVTTASSVVITNTLNGTLVASLASSTATFGFPNATTTAPQSRMSVPSTVKRTLAKVDCYEAASATTTMELYYNTTIASTSVQQVLLSSIQCGINGTSTTSFTTSSIPSNAYIFALVSSTAGTPTQTTLNIYTLKL